MAKLDMPKDAYLQVVGGRLASDTSVGVPTMLDEVIAIKDRVDAGDETLTANERKKLATVPLRSPAGDGYSYECELLYQRVQQIESKLSHLTRDLEFCNLYHRGFTVLTFSLEEACAEYLFVNTVTVRDYKDTCLSKAFKVTAAEPTKLVKA